MEKTHIRISLKVAKYILETSVRLISHLHGSEYDPNSGRLGEMIVEAPSLFEQQNPRDLPLIHWFSSASALLRLISGIINYEVETDYVNEVYDEFANHDDDEESQRGLLL